MDKEVKWDELRPKLSDICLKALDKLGFERTTPVQTACIPLFLSNKDVAVEAVTGSGKTLAFVIPVIDIILKRDSKPTKHQILSIILSPTWELATQIHDVVKVFAEIAELSSILCVGGTDPDTQVKQFCDNGANIIVATPGRLEDLFERRSMNLRSYVRELEVLILDEADRLLELGYEKSIGTIMSCLPKQRRTGLFSATQTDKVENIIRAGLRNPVQVSITQDKGLNEHSQKTPNSLQNYYTKEKCIVFVSTCAAVEFFAKILEILLKTTSILSIHGKMKQKRGKVFSKFKAMLSGILVTTDVMARGVDIPDVDWVMQFDPPSNASGFVHRCGRTARIGKKGQAVLFLLESEEPYVEFLTINQKAPMEQLKIEHEVPDIAPKLRKLASKDRDIMDKGLRSFVSFVQSYRKHECRLIFQIKELNLGKLATGFGLLKLPKMPEIKPNASKDFITLKDLDLEAIPYKDKFREKARKTRSIEYSKKKEEKNRKYEEIDKAWSKEKFRKETKQKRKDKKDLKRKHKAYSQTEIDDLGKEISLMKKLKKKKISKEQFNDEIVDEIEET